MGTSVSCSLSVEVSWTPVSPQPEMESKSNRVKCYHGLTLLTIDVPILVNKAFTNVRKTDWAEDREIHSLFCELVVKWISLKIG